MHLFFKDDLRSWFTSPLDFDHHLEILTIPIFSLVFTVLLFRDPWQTANASSTIASATPSGDDAGGPTFSPVFTLHGLLTIVSGSCVGGLINQQ
ncbi:unnamed protein product [Schistocephalus solidus]|uniref:Magnesium transporter n=1 Tax=Schistocephalus solidus TaxID=70667 RepID=A0A183TLJ3_SCHSO|nr:unnamed protein product [Schistocephalus solidus]